MDKNKSEFDFISPPDRADIYIKFLPCLIIKRGEYI